MKPTIPRAMRRPWGHLARMALAAGLTVGLLGDSAAPAATAAAPPEPPTLQWVRVDPPASVMYQFNLNGDAPVNGVRLNVYQNNRFVQAFQQQLSPGDRDGKVTNPQSPGIFKPNTRYCVGLLTYVGTGNNSSSTFSEESERHCFTIPPYAESEGAPKPPPPPPPPPKPDLAVMGVTGPTELAVGETATYEIVLRNEGAPVKDVALLQIGRGQQIQLVEAAEASTNGITCQSNGLGIGCFGSLGGDDDPAESRTATINVQVMGMVAGEVHLVASANHGRTIEEKTVDNNLKLLEVTVK